VHLVGFTIEIYYDTRSYKRQTTDLYSSPNIIRVTKARKIRWAGYVARTGEK